MSRPALPGWLLARPIAHRGLHALEEGRIENTASAARAAIEHGFAIECDVQLTLDGDAVVFHDVDLGRLTGETGLVADRTSRALQAIHYRSGPDRIGTLGDLLDLIDGRVPLICEIKSRFDGDLRLTERVRELLAGYGGPVALKSFDPEIIAHLRADPPAPLGIVAEAAYTDPAWSMLSPTLRRDLAAMLHFERTRPDFLSFHVADLPHAVPTLCRTVIGCPVLAWTVRTPAQRVTADRWADQMVFEGFVP